MDTTLFLSLGAPYYRHNGQLYVELQTVSGISGWLEEFQNLICFGIVFDRPPPATYVLQSEVPFEASRVTHVPLPNGYDIKTYLRERKAVRKTLAHHAAAAEYCVFSFGGWIGDWGMEAASVCREMGKKHAVWLDRVESDVVKQQRGRGTLAWLKSMLRSAVIARNERIALSGATLGMLHGKTVFDKLAHYSPNPAQIEDIHVKGKDRIPDELMQAKRNRPDDSVLRIVYAGRLTPMKGPHDWVAVVDMAQARGARIEAHWYGDGDLADAVAADIEKREIEDVCHLGGFVSARAQILEHLRDGDVLLFCHLTDESPRILIETLHCGTPMVGYRDPFAGELVEEQGGGVLVPRGNTAALADEIVRLAADRDALRVLQEKAFNSARHLTHESVFAHRCAIVKSELAPA